MKKINNKSINLSLKILTIFVFGLIFVPFNKASADTYYNTGWQLREQSVGATSGIYNNSYYNTAPYQAPVYIAPAPAATPIVYSNETNPNPVMTVNYAPNATTSVAKAKTTASAPKTVASASDATTTDSNPDNGNSLAANAVYGSNSFLPSGLIQWILFAIFILLLVILTRKIFGAKENYNSTPLKQV